MKKIIYHLKANGGFCPLPSKKILKSDTDYIRTGDILIFTGDFGARFKVVRREVVVSDSCSFIHIYLFISSVDEIDWMLTNERFLKIRELSLDKSINSAARFESGNHNKKDLVFYKCLAKKIYERIKDYTSWTEHDCLQSIINQLDEDYNLGLHDD